MEVVQEAPIIDAPSPSPEQGPRDVAQADQNAEAAAAKEQQRAEEPEQDEVEEEESTDGKRRGGLQKRFAKLTQRTRAQDAELAYLRGRVEQLTAGGGNTSSPELKEVGPPDPSQYPGGTLDRRFIDDMIDYRVQAQLSAARRNESQLTARQQDEAVLDHLRGRLADGMNAGSERFDDFEEAVGDPRLPFTEAVAFTVATTEDPPAVLYALAKNPKELARIAPLPPMMIAREIGRFEERLAKGQIGQATTKAPSPPSTVRPGGGVASKDPEKMSMAEYVAYKRRGGG